MGLLGRLGQLHGPAFGRWRPSQERWATILGVQRFGPIARVQLEVHVGGLPVHEVTTTSRIPRGIEPEVGQHVAFHMHDNGSGSAASYIIDWRKEPQYGAPPLYAPRPAG
jgi:hypothetical protein